SMSSRSPGCSPTSISRAFRAPSPTTAWVVPSHSSQARQPCAASRSDRRLGRAGTGAALGWSWAVDIDLRWGYPKHEAGTHRMLRVELRRLARSLLPAQGAAPALARALRGAL